MGFSPGVGLLVQALDVGLELGPVDPPYSSAPDLDGGQLSRPHQRIDLRDAHAQIGGHILEREKARLDLRARFLCSRLARHGPTIPADGDRYMDLTMFAAV